MSPSSKGLNVKLI